MLVNAQIEYRGGETHVQHPLCANPGREVVVTARCKGRPVWSRRDYALRENKRFAAHIVGRSAEFVWQGSWWSELKEGL